MRSKPNTAALVAGLMAGLWDRPHGAFTIAASNTLEIKPIEPSIKGCLRHGQVERRRKIRYKRRRKIVYRKAS